MFRKKKRAQVAYSGSFQPPSRRSDTVRRARSTAGGLKKKTISAAEVEATLQASYLPSEKHPENDSAFGSGFEDDDEVRGIFIK